MVDVVGSLGAKAGLTKAEVESMDCLPRLVVDVDLFLVAFVTSPSTLLRGTARDVEAAVDVCITRRSRKSERGDGKRIKTIISQLCFFWNFLACFDGQKIDVTANIQSMYR